MLAPLGIAAQVRADPTLASYIRIFFEFQDYQRRTAEVKFVIHGIAQNEEYGEYEHIRILPYAHRFTPTYQKRQIASFYQLEAWMKDNPRVVSMLTLTTYQSGEHSVKVKGHVVNIPEAFDIIKKGWDNLSKVLRKYVPGLEYILAMEAHKSGYPHFYIFLLTPEPIPETLQQKCRFLWEKKYKAGSAKNGIVFTFKTSDKSVVSIRNYLLKYVCKSFYAITSKFPDKDDMNKMTAGRHVFNALVWKHGWRLIQKSRGLSKVMRYRRPDTSDECQAVELSRPVSGAHEHSEKREFITTWVKDGVAFEHFNPNYDGIKEL
jgi:hypothetical protein